MICVFLTFLANVSYYFTSSVEVIGDILDKYTKDVMHVSPLLFLLHDRVLELHNLARVSRVSEVQLNLSQPLHDISTGCTQ